MLLRSWLTHRGLAAELIGRLIRRDLRLMPITSEWRALELPGPGRLAVSRRARPWQGALVTVRATPTHRAFVARIVGFAGDEIDGRPLTPGRVSLRLALDDSLVELGFDQIDGVALAHLNVSTIRDLRAVVRHVHSQAAITRLLGWSRELWTDVTHRTVTRGLVRSDACGFSPSHVFAYVPTPWDVASRALTALSVSGDDVFVDYGSGKGRMLALALEHPFRRVVGVELVPDLARIARLNTARFGSRCVVIEADATRVELPDDASVVYLFNPFGPAELNRVFTHIRASHARRPRLLRVVTYGVDPAVLAVLPGTTMQLTTDPVWLRTLDASGGAGSAGPKSPISLA